MHSLQADEELVEKNGKGGGGSYIIGGGFSCIIKVICRKTQELKFSPWFMSLAHSYMLEN